MTEKLSLLTELIKLARADKEFRDTEYEFLVTMAELLGVEKHELDQLFNRYVQFSPPKIEAQRILQFHRMVLFTNVDLEVDSAELEHMRLAGLKLGLRPKSIEAVFKEMKNHENGAIPAEELISIFQVYHN